MKKPTPKKRQSRSSSSARYKTFQNKARAFLQGRVDAMMKLEKRGKLEKAEKKSMTAAKVTKIKA